MMERAPNRQPSLYIHFPFCEAKCHYCDFFSFAEHSIPDSTRTRLYDSILREVETAFPSSSSRQDTTTVETIFFGGGTPSLVDPSLLRQILSKISRADSCEITLEANPSSISLDRASAWREMGINRISMGLQSGHEERLRWLGRIHTVDAAQRALEILHEASIPAISADYMIGVPGQTAKDIESELGTLLRQFPKIKHLSIYLLTLQPENPRYKELPHEDVQLQLLRFTAQYMEDAGFEQYEISNFAKLDPRTPSSPSPFRSRHNENYWLSQGYEAIGPAAHGYDVIAGERFKNWSNLEKYIKSTESGLAPREWTETLTDEQKRLEAILLGMRRREGIDLIDFQNRFGYDLASAKADFIGWAQDKGWVQREPCRESSCRNPEDVPSAKSPDLPKLGRLQLTQEGRFLADSIIAQLASLP